MLRGANETWWDENLLELGSSLELSILPKVERSTSQMFLDCTCAVPPCLPPDCVADLQRQHTHPTVDNGNSVQLADTMFLAESSTLSTPVPVAVPQ
jgi:hypothetical protein